MLDKGGMSSIWLAEDSRLQEKVALKFLPEEILKDPVAFQEMRKETTKSRKFSHPNIIRIYDLHESPDEAPFISMEFVEGDNLHNLSGQQPNGIFSWERLRPWVTQLCDALTYAHNEGVIHRDIKPANMMVDTKGRLKLADFGISMSIDESKRRGNSNPINGTLGYMSPQQLSGYPAHVTDDIHALGATLYELLTGRRPFQSKDLYTEVMNTKPKPLNEALWEQGLTNNIPPDVSALIMACLAKDPSMRPASAKLVSDWLGLEPKPEEPAPQPLRTASKAASDTAATEEPIEKSKGPNWAIIVGLALALIAASALLVIIKRQLASGTDKEQASATGNQSPTPQVIYVTNSVSVTNFTSAKQISTNAGAIDERFTPPGGPNKIVFASILQPDGKYVVGGDFTRASGYDCSRIARYNPDGSIDQSFSKHGGINEEIAAMALLPDGKILIGGRFVTVYGQKVGHLARLNPDGSLDRTFPVMIPDYTVTCIAFQADGKILVGGKFSQVSPSKTERNCLVRLNPDGSVDESLHIGRGADGQVDCIGVQSDGRIVLAGKFAKFHDRDCSRIVRLMPTGVIDKTFVIGTGFDASVMALKIQPDGNILVGGQFNHYDGQRSINLIRLDRDGNVEKRFTTGANAFVGAIEMEGPDLIWVGGNFTTFDGKPCHRLVRLRLDGTRDPDFEINTGTDGSVRTLTLVHNVGMLAGGNFNNFAGKSTPHLVMVRTGRPSATKAVSSNLRPGLNPAGK